MVLPESAGYTGGLFGCRYAYRARTEARA